MTNLNLNVVTTREAIARDVVAASNAFDGPVDRGAFEQAILGLYAAFPPGEKQDEGLPVQVALAMNEVPGSTTVTISVTMQRSLLNPKP